MENIDEDIKILEELKKVEERISKNQVFAKEDRNTAIKRIKAIENLLSRLKTAEKELEKYKDVTYFEKLEDGNLYKIDKERADDLYKHGNGCWLYIQMWARKKVEENV